MQKRIFLLTGAPGVGKTTIIFKVVNALKEAGFYVGGMLSREARVNGSRVGFEIINLSSGQHGWLAQINQKQGPKVGKYRVNIDDLKNIGSVAIRDAVEKSSLIVIDEIGPMELFSEDFKQSVKLALESSKLVLAVVHEHASDNLIKQAKQSADSELFIVSLANRESLPNELTSKAIAFLRN